MLAQGTNPQHVLLNWCYVYLDKLIRQTVDDDIVGLQPALLPPLLGQHSLNGKMDAKCNQFWIEPRHVRQLSATTSDPDTHIFNFNHLLYTAKRANRHILQCVYVCVCVCAGRCGEGRGGPGRDWPRRKKGVREGRGGPRREKVCSNTHTNAH